ncbi:hypothetical protein N185_15975 [Sinorhizobium sp. GW3]|nr:hypothetical protein N185_15975 [Sinorhizobium sp. GW3]
MFVAWAVLNGLAGEIITGEFATDVQSLQSREQTPGAWLLSVCDGKFVDEYLSDEGNRFSLDYYGDDDGLH